jgi:cytochrome c oxidase assembly protein subunit 15
MSLLDWTPVFQVMLAGLVLAIFPLAWVWVRQRAHDPSRRLHALTLLTVFLTFDLIVFGAFTRLTDSGLGCPDWPGCYGSATPIGALSNIQAAQSAMPTGPVTLSKAWIEMIHRYLATGVGALILVICALSWWARARAAKQAAGSGAAPALVGISPWLATFTLLWVCVQGAFGALTVTMKLFPAIVTLHLLGGLTLLGLLTWQAVQGRPVAAAGPLPAPGRVLRNALLAGMALLVLQIALGGWVSTNYAVLACTEFPMCQSRWWPEMNFAQGFTLWRELGLTPQGSPISFEALTAIHMVHRLMAVVVVLALGALAWRMKRSSWRTQGRWLNLLLLLQIITGLSNVVLGWPLLAAVLHTGGAAALLAVMVWALAQYPRLVQSQSALPVERESASAAHAPRAPLTSNLSA